MGLIRAAIDSVSSLLADQWREYFYCDSLSNDVIMVKGQKRVDNKKGNKGNDNIISNGSIIAVNEGQCMIIVDQGGIVDICADPGEFIYDNSTEPSIFYGKLGENLKNSFKILAQRFTFGGSTAKDQRVYFFNIKEIMNNLYGTATPIPFHIVDSNTGFSFETNLKCNGTYTFRLVDPLIFYKNVAANVFDSYDKAEIATTMKGELVQAMQPVLAEIGGRGVLPSQLVGHTNDIRDLAKKELAVLWGEQRGIEIVNITIMPSFPPEDIERINKWADTAMMRNMDMQNARKAEALANMMDNSRGTASAGSTDPMSAMMGMMAVNMMGNMMGGTAQPAQSVPVAPAAGVAAAGAAIPGWTCAKCGHADNRGKFCAECGAQKPSGAGWTCSCGTVNQGKFCADCGAKKPDGAPIYKCDKCGWEPEDPANPPKFCPECGDVFDDDDKV